MTPPSNNSALPGPDDILRRELNNGITVLARENFSSPAVVVSGLLRAGSLLEPPEKAGLASFHSSLMMRGTEQHRFDELYEEIEGIGASLSFGSGGHTYRFSSKSLAEDLPQMLNLTAEVICQPTFPEEHVERVRGQIMTSLQMRAHNTRSMAALKFIELAYPDGHPYGRSVNGYLDTIPAITRDDIVSFHKNLGPHKAVIVVVGAVKAEEAVRLVKDALGQWENPQQPDILSAPDALRLTTPRREHVLIPGKTQSDLVLGFPGPARANPDFHAARLANSILGEFGMYGRLGDAVRKAQGLAYYSYSRMTGGFGPGPWRVIAGVAPEKVEQAVETIREEIRRIVDEPVSDEELAENRAYFKGQLVLSLETNEGVAESIKLMEMHDLGLDYLCRYAAMIDAITIEQIQKAAANYLDPDAYALAVAGPD
ncbi:MAG: insulinase family protein [Anaerolineae bacterium]|nr:insulinase family protein [Anaerolineae bacterium]